MTLIRLLRWLSARLTAVRFGATDTGRGESVTGRLVSARSTGESVPAAVVMVVFRNDSANAVDILSYRLRWSGGTFSAEPKDLRVPANTEIERTVRVDSTNGDIAALLVCSQAAVEVVSAHSR